MTLNKLRLQANEKGFTLIELMIVIAIIGILAAIAIPNYISYRDKAYCSAAESDAQAIAGALADYFSIPGNQSKADVAASHQIAFANSATITLSGTNTGTITQTASTATTPTYYKISVTDVGQRCPQTYQSGNAKWSNAKPGVYSITL